MNKLIKTITNTHTQTHKNHKTPRTPKTHKTYIHTHTHTKSQTHARIHTHTISQSQTHKNRHNITYTHKILAYILQRENKKRIRRREVQIWVRSKIYYNNNILFGEYTTRRKQKKKNTIWVRSTIYYRYRPIYYSRYSRIYYNFNTDLSKIYYKPLKPQLRCSPPLMLLMSSPKPALAMNWSELELSFARNLKSWQYEEHVRTTRYEIEFLSRPERDLAKGNGARTVRRNVASSRSFSCPFESPCHWRNLIQHTPRMVATTVRRPLGYARRLGD